VLNEQIDMHAGGVQQKGAVGETSRAAQRTRVDEGGRSMSVENIRKPAPSFGRSLALAEPEGLCA
jgi:hypothetical protein